MHRPTAVPRMPASASGVSTQRSSPKVSRSPAVARKPPPARPTSSPMTSTFSSRPSSWWRQSLIASTRVSSLTGKDPPQLCEVVVERARRMRECGCEENGRVGIGLGLRLRDRVAHELSRLLADRVAHLVGEQPAPLEVALVAADALAPALLLDTLGVDVDARVVGGRVRRGAIGDCLDKGRAFAG